MATERDQERARGKLESSVRAGLGHFLTVGPWPQVLLSLSLLLCEMGSRAAAQGLTCVPMGASGVTASVAQYRCCPAPMWRTDAAGCGWWDTPCLCSQRCPGDWQAEPLPLLNVRPELGEPMWSGCLIKYAYFILSTLQTSPMCARVCRHSVPSIMRGHVC